MLFSRKSAKMKYKRRLNFLCVTAEPLRGCVKPSGKKFLQVRYLPDMVNIMLDQTVQ